MQKRSLICSFLVLCVLVLASCSSSKPTYEPRPTPSPRPAPAPDPEPDPEPRDWPALNRMQESLITPLLVYLVLEDSEKNFSPAGTLPLLGTYLSKGEDAQFTYRLEGGTSYLFIAGGDQNAVDLDLYLYDDDGENVGSGTDIDEAVDGKRLVSNVLEFTPPRTGDYKVRMRLFTGKADRSMCSLLIMQEGEKTVEPNRIAEVLENYGTFSKILNEEILKTCAACELDFFHQDGEWAIYGALLDSGKGTAISGINMPDDIHMFVSAPDDGLRDADLFLRNRADEVILEDVESDAYPKLVLESDSDEVYKLTIRNESSSGPSFVLVSILGIY